MDFCFPIRAVARAVPLTGRLAIAIGVIGAGLAGLSMQSQAGPWRATVSQCGQASWYGGKWAGRPTANGETYDPQTLTAAHKTLPFGTRVKVTRHTGTGSAHAVVVRINNRGPFVKGRVIDLSEKAAEALASKQHGVAKVCLEESRR